MREKNKLSKKKATKRNVVHEKCKKKIFVFCGFIYLLLFKIESFSKSLHT